jgi:hypothetical protein
MTARKIAYLSRRVRCLTVVGQYELGHVLIGRTVIAISVNVIRVNCRGLLCIPTPPDLAATAGGHST